MTLNNNIQNAILNTFQLSNNVSHNIIIDKIKIIDGLPALFTMLLDDRTPEKAMMLELEKIIVAIKLKDKRSLLETTFLNQIDEWVDQPLYRGFSL